MKTNLVGSYDSLHTPAEHIFGGGIDIRKNFISADLFVQKYTFDQRKSLAPTNVNKLCC